MISILILQSLSMKVCVFIILEIENFDFFFFYENLCLDLCFLQVSRVSMSFEHEFCEVRFSSFFIVVCLKSFERGFKQTINNHNKDNVSKKKENN